MRTFKLLTLALLSIVFVVLCSCSSDNPTDDNQQGDFTFLKIGNWWINENYIIDSLGNKTGNSTTDSTFIAETEVKLGKTSFKLKTKVTGVTINGTFTISAEKGITKSITVNSKSFTAQEFKLIFKFKGYLSIMP